MLVYKQGQHSGSPAQVQIDALTSGMDDKQIRSSFHCLCNSLKLLNLIFSPEALGVCFISQFIIEAGDFISALQIALLC